MAAPWARTDFGAPVEHDERIAYVRDHGFRAMGQLALFDQEGASALGDRLKGWLRALEDPLWTLAYASALLPYDRRFVDEFSHAPYTPARDLVRCLVPETLQWHLDERRTGPSVSRTALSPYGIDLELLTLIVLGRTPGTDPAVVSVISMPALVRTLFASIEAALAEAREDGYHWEAGLSFVQPTDPEVLIAVRAVLRSEAAGPARDLPGDLPMSRALVDLVLELGP